MAQSTPEKAFGSSIAAAVMLALRNDSFRVIAENVKPKLMRELSQALLAVLAAEWPAVENSGQYCLFESFAIELRVRVETLYVW